MNSYNLIFLIDHLHSRSRQVIRGKLDAFLKGRRGSVSLWIEGGETRSFATSESLPEHDFSYPLFWILSEGVPATEAPSLLRDRKLYMPKSFSEINSFFDTLMETCTWALFPWGGVATYRALCFLTSEESAADEFISAQPNEFRPYEIYGATIPKDITAKSYTSIISSRRVLSGVESAVKCAVFEEESDTRGRSVWDACVSAGKAPLIVSNHFEHEVEDVMLEKWDNAQFAICDRFWVDGGTLGGVELALYAPRDEASFFKMCHRGGSSVTCLFAFPASAEIDRVRSFVKEIESSYRYSDLCHLNAYLDAADWVYALERGHMDVEYSVFTSHQSALVARVGGHPSASLLALF